MEEDRDLGYVCRTLTIFSISGEFDPLGYERYLTRFIEPRIGIYVASSGSGSGQALAFDDLRRVYSVAVGLGKGLIPVGANIPEQFTPSLSIEHAQLAIDADVDIVNIYGPDGRHGFRPTDEEYARYFDLIFDQVRWPISLCPNPVLGYTPNAKVIAALCDKYTQVENVVLTGLEGNDMYFIELMDALNRDVRVYVTIEGSFNTLALGAAGLAGNLANLAPETHRLYLDMFASGNLTGASEVYRQLRHLAQYTDRWGEVSARWQPMFLKAFGMPGGNGILPPPYLNYDDEEVTRFAAGIVGLKIPEIERFSHQSQVDSQDGS